MGSSKGSGSQRGGEAVDGGDRDCGSEIPLIAPSPRLFPHLNMDVPGMHF